MYRTGQIRIRKGHRLYDYFKEQCTGSGDLYNRANYLIRQYATGKRDLENGKRMGELTENQREAMELIDQVTKGTKYEPKGKWLSYECLDHVLKKTKDKAYTGLPSQSNQQILKRVLRDYRSFFEVLKVYEKDRNVLTGRPKLPKYRKGRKGITAVFTNQICKIQEERYLKFPFTKNRINIGDIGKVYRNKKHKENYNKNHNENGNAGEKVRLKEVRIKPTADGFIVEVVLELLNIDTEILKKKNPLFGYEEKELREMLSENTEMKYRCASIDPGLENFCAVTNTIGERPFIIKGSSLKSENHYYNKKRAELSSRAKICNGLHTTKRIERLTEKRNRIIKDQMHKISRKIADWAEEKNIQLLVMGHNRYQKQKIELSDVNNQNFVQIPYKVFTDMLRYKLEERGIRFLLTEEAYTSKADFLACDEIPEYKRGEEPPKHSGERFRRGLYRHGDGSISNADINGAANILRKVFPEIKVWDRGIVDVPYAVRIA